MLIADLPRITAVSALNGSTFETVVFCRFISLSGTTRRFSHSQRQVLSLFNRSSQRVVSKYLKRAQSRGFLTKVSLSSGEDPDEYVRGNFFERDSDEVRMVIALANSLWGRQGLLRNWPYPSAWGHGCLPPAVILILATLRVLNESITTAALRAYLSPLTPESSFRNALRFIRRHGLIPFEQEQIVLSPDWELKLQQILENKSACNERQRVGDARRKRESAQNRARLAKSTLSEEQRKSLILLPCVVHGCERRRREIEHFPPRHFLTGLPVITNEYLTWSVCKTHNHAMQGFIKRLPNYGTANPSALVLMSRGDAVRIYKAVSSHNVVKFHNAFLRDDIPCATTAAIATLRVWTAIATSSLVHHEVRTSPPSNREHVGEKALNPNKSQLPY